MKYTNNALNIITAMSYKGVKNAWVINNINGDETDAEISQKLKISVYDFTQKKDVFRKKLDDLSTHLDGIVAYNDENFPKYNAKDIKNLEKPVFLTYRGNLDLISSNYFKITVIGLLNPTKDIEILEEKMVALMRECVIVSGLANGCDSVSHKAALKNSLPTVAILPSTIKNILPKENSNLANEIVKNRGLLISEYIDEVEIKSRFDINKLSQRYIQRDRLQALFSDMICLVASYSKDDTFVNDKKTKKDSGSRFALQKAKEWGIPRFAMYGDDEIYKSEMFNLNKEILNDGAKEINLSNVTKIIANLKESRAKNTLKNKTLFD